MLGCLFVNALPAAAASITRSPLSYFSARLNQRWLWLTLACALLATSYFVVVRSCGYDHGSLLRYAAYLVLYVALPGFLFLGIAQRRMPSALEALAVGLPLGFAVEISLFFLASAFHFKFLLPFSPLLWLTFGYAQKGWTRSRPSFRPRWEMDTLRGACAVAVLVLAFTVTIVSQFYACAPMANGVLGTATNHDWIYLLSRAGEIKQRWPLQDPSLAGSPLSYHYFLLVHLASASFVTGIKLELIGLRFFVLPLSAALIAQSLWLGKTLTRNVWGGVLATALLLVANELSFSDPSAGSRFGNEFVRWLFISPTFFFGMVFTGALILWIYRLLAAERLNGWEGLLLGVLAAVGTGAKGTVVPPLLVGLGLWWLVEAIKTRQLPIKTTLLLLILGGGFGLVYFCILSSWGTGAASFSPLFSIKLSQFWQEHAERWMTLLTSWGLSSRFGLLLAHSACMLAVLIGFSGVRVLGLLALWRAKDQPNPALIGWLSLCTAMYFAFGHCLVLDSNSQFYLLFPVRLPQAVLAASAILWIFSKVKTHLADFSGLTFVYIRRTALMALAIVIGALVFTESISWWLGMVLIVLAVFFSAPSPRERAVATQARFGRFVWRVSPLIAVTAVTLIQVNHWRLSNVQGFKLWLTQSAVAADKEVVLLREAMDWIRTNTPSDSVFVANAFSERNLRPDAMAQLDNTTVDKYYYYSAFAERRFWVEGPTYLRDQYVAARRITTASEVFSGGPVSLLFNEGKERPDYIVLDRELQDDATVRLPADRCVFENARIAVYHLVPPMPLPEERVALARP